MLRTSDAEEIAGLFDLGATASLCGPVARGELGQVWRLDTTAGSFAIKEPFERYTDEELALSEDDARFQQAVRLGGVPMPGVVRSIFGSAIEPIRSTSARVYEWVDLNEPDVLVDPADVGAVVASIHAVRHEGRSPRHWWYTDPVGVEAWDQLVEDCRAAAAPFVEQFDSMVPELAALEGLLEEPADLQTCHRDLFADNILGTPEGGLCVIDWENSGLADPSQELAVVLFEFSSGDTGRAAALYESYVESGGRGRIERPGHFSMAIAQFGHLGQHYARRWLDPARVADRGRNERHMAEFLGDPLTREVIDRLLDAIG